MGKGTVFWFKPDDFSVGLKKSEGGVDNEIKIELLDYICFFLKNLGSSVLIGATGDKLFKGRNLIGLFEFGSYEKSSYSHQL